MRVSTLDQNEQRQLGGLAQDRVFIDKGVRVEFLEEHLVFTGEDSPAATLMLSVMEPSPSSNAP